MVQEAKKKKVQKKNENVINAAVQGYLQEKEKQEKKQKKKINS